MGINNTKKCTFSFLLELQVELQVLVILGAASFVNSPGEIFWRSSAILQMRSVEENPGAPGESQHRPEGQQKMADFREFGSLSTLTCAPVLPAPVLKANKKWRTSGSLGV